MVKSFLNNYRNSNLIHGEKTVENFLINNNEEDGSSIFISRIREQDLSAEQKLNELKGLIEELARKAEIKRIELESQAASCIDETLSQVELKIKDDEDYFTDNDQGVFANFFESLFNLFEVNVDLKVYKTLKEKKEKNLLLSIIKFLRDKLKELVKKIFKRDLDLSWDKRLDKEIKELQEKLLSGGLSLEEEIAILERLQALQNLKLKLQTFLVGSVIAMFAEIFAVDLAAVVEQDATEKDKDKKAEKTEVEGKEVRKEIEVNEVAPVHLFNFSSKVPTPITLNKQDRDLLPKSIKNFIDIPPKIVINRQDNKVQITGKMDDKDKKVKPEPVVCTTAPHQNPPRRIRRYNSFGMKGPRQSPECSRSMNNKQKPHAPVERPERLTNIKVESHISPISKGKDM